MGCSICVSRKMAAAPEPHLADRDGRAAEPRAAMRAAYVAGRSTWLTGRGRPGLAVDRCLPLKLRRQPVYLHFEVLVVAPGSHRTLDDLAHGLDRLALPDTDAESV